MMQDSSQGDPHHTATNLASGKTYYFCISAFDSASNESPCSAEVSKPIL
jgi:hypothetical protein